MAYESNKGVSNVAAVLNKRMQEITGRIPAPLDTGIVQDDYSLKLNAFDIPIPRGMYSICRQLTHGEANTHLTYTVAAGRANDGTHSHGTSGIHSHSGGTHEGHINGGEHTHSGDGSHAHTKEGPHIHDVLVPEKMRGLMPGDRVLAALVGSEAIVIDIIIKS